MSWEIFVLHGYDSIHWVAKSCTTTEIHHLHWELCSARGTAPPMRLLHGALVILVLWQISQFRSLGKWIFSLCLPKSTLLEGVDSKDGSWEELACESLRSRTLIIHEIFSEFLQPFQYVGMQQVSPFWIVVVVCIWFWIFGWFGQRVSHVLSFQHVYLTQKLEKNLLHTTLPVTQSNCRLTQLEMSWLVR